MIRAAGLLAAIVLTASCGPSLSITPQAAAELEPGPACPLEAGPVWRVEQATDEGWRTAGRLRLAAIPAPDGGAVAGCELSLLDLEPLARAEPMALRPVRTALMQIADAGSFAGPGETILITTQLPRTEQQIAGEAVVLAGTVSREDLEAPEPAGVLVRRGDGRLELLDRCRGLDAADWTGRVSPLLLRLGLLPAGRTPPAQDTEDAAPRGLCGVLRSRAALEALWAAGLPDTPSWRFVRDRADRP